MFILQIIKKDLLFVSTLFMHFFTINIIYKVEEVRDVNKIGFGFFNR